MSALKKIGKILAKPFVWICLGLIYEYKYCISPLLPHTCKFVPTCSAYAILAVKEFGPVKGSAIAFKRICRCTPLSKQSGEDPIPLNIKGDLKWLI